MEQIKKQASSFLQDKYKLARIAFTDVTEAEVLVEEATNGAPCSPDAKTMTKIAEASYFVDDYWRIVDLLHKRFFCVDWKQWRQSYKTLTLLEFLLTHGPEDFAAEFSCDTDVIEELGTFRYIDDKGFDWGASMQRKSEEIVKLLGGGKAALREARFRALRVTKEIQGFGSSLSSPSSSSISDRSSRTSSFGSFSANETNSEPETKAPRFLEISYSNGGIRDYDDEDDDYEDEDDDDNEKDSILHARNEKDGFASRIFSKLTCFATSSKGDKHGFRSVSDVGTRVSKKKKLYNRQSSLWY